MFLCEKLGDYFLLHKKMKSIIPILFLLSVLITNCAEKREVIKIHLPNSTDTLVEIPDTSVDKALLVHNKAKSLWTLDDQAYSGYIVSFYQDRTLKEKIGLFNGKKEGQLQRWYPDGHLKQVANYSKGKLHGEKKVWTSDKDHVLISQLNYQSGKVHGAQTKWYPSGELYKKLNLNMGKEEGIQQAFRINGDLYANYEAKNGRIFGLKKAALCFGLEDENFQYEK